MITQEALAEALNIVIDLSDEDAPNDSEYGNCRLCVDVFWSSDTEKHASYCPWRRSVEFARKYFPKQEES